MGLEGGSTYKSMGTGKDVRGFPRCVSQPGMEHGSNDLALGVGELAWEGSSLNTVVYASA